MGFFQDNASAGELPKHRLYYIGLTPPLYWTDFGDFDIEWNGIRWLAAPITPGPISNQPDGTSASFKIADANDTLFPILAAANGGELALAAIYEAGFAVMNATPVPDEVVQIFSGRVDRSTVDTSGTDMIEIILMPPLQTGAGELPTRLISTLVRTP
jgi:hypothetical protein